MKKLLSVLVIALALSAVSVHAETGKDKVEAAKSKGVPVFIDFGKTTCKPCKMMVPVLEELTKKYKGRMEVVFVHVDDEKDYALKMGVTMIPTQVLLDKTGKEVSRHVGYIPVEDCDKMVAGTVAADTADKPKAAAKKDTSAKKKNAGKTCSPGAVCK